jgi:hypothetical protein
MRLTKPRMTAAVLVLALGLVAACTPASDQPSADQALCDSLATFADSVQAIGDLDPASDSVDDIRAGVATSEEAWQDVKGAAAAVDEANEAAVEESWTEMKQEIDDFPTDMPMTDAVVEVATAVAELQHAYGEMANGLGCESSS